MIKAWIDITFPPVMMSSGNAIVWDSCPAHTAKAVKEYLNRRGIKNVVIPGRLTPYVQAGDLGIYKSFKDKIKPIIADWKSSDQVERTRNGNPKPPQQNIICKWVLDAWNRVDASVILNSIKAAGFGEEQEWMIYKHDVYGNEFKNAWLSRDIMPIVLEEFENLVVEDEGVVMEE